MQATSLFVRYHATEQGPRIEVNGDADTSSIPPMREALLQAISGNPSPNIFLDLRGLNYIDSAGLGLILEASRKLASESRTLHVWITPGRQPDRVLRLCRFDSLRNVAVSMPHQA